VSPFLDGGWLCQLAGTAGRRQRWRARVHSRTVPGCACGG